MTVHRTTVAAMLGGALLLALAPRTAAAQWRSDTERAMRATVTLAPAVQTAAPAPAFQAAQARHRGRGPATLLMIVGGAALVVGVVADETLLVFGGFGVAMYGGYLYLR